MEDLLILLKDNLLWPVISVGGGGVLSRLWIGYIFRSEVNNHKVDLKKIQEAYEELVWNEMLPAGGSKAYPTLLYLGQFTWEEIRLPLKLCTILFWKRKDRNAIRRFLQFEQEFKDQPNYLELDTHVCRHTYGEYIKKHIWCYNFMRNIGLFGTNNAFFDGSHISEALPSAYGIELDKNKAFENYCKKKGVKFADLNDILSLPERKLVGNKI